jgi:hypothetical protein
MLHPVFSDLLRSVSRRVAFPTPMNAYDGCHITIHVPVDFGNEKEKQLRQLDRETTQTRYKFIEQ